MKMINELRLKNITRYEDVEEGQLELTINGRMKHWYAIWLTSLFYNGGGDRSLPRKTLPLGFKHYHGWIDCPRIILNRQNFMWIEPLNCCSWVDMGVNLYLCSSSGWPEPLPRIEYVNMVRALLGYGISEITVDEPFIISKDSRFHSNNIMGLDDFWDN